MTALPIATGRDLCRINRRRPGIRAWISRHREDLVTAAALCLFLVVYVAVCSLDHAS